MNQSHDDLVARLDEIAEDIADRAIERLKRALQDGETGRIDDERRLTQARRAVEKAAHILRSSGAAEPD